MRDETLVTGHGPEGNATPQFNPNTVGVVIIGSVMIGANSSFGSGPFTYAGSSIASSGSFFSFGTISCHQDSPANKGGASQRADMSSLLSRRLPLRGNPNRQTTKRQRRGRSVWLDRNGLDHVSKNGPPARRSRRLDPRLPVRPCQ